MSYKRPLSNILSALFDKYHIFGILRGIVTYKNPLKSLYSYIFMRPIKVDQIEVKFKGNILFDVSSIDDLITIHEIFCRKDYVAPNDAKVIVDFGSNIGISSIFFHKCAPKAKIFLFEPDQRNLVILKKNLSRFNFKFELNEIAVTSNIDGFVQFGILDSGRYGGVGLDTGNLIEVPAKSASSVLNEIISQHGEIDVLKIDVENLESEILESLDASILSKIKLMFIEFPKNVRPQIDGFDMTYIGQVCCYNRKILQ
ncbi:FkbM family methyltransferase [Gammaproteobacteria bacterium]|nr:FkbM family methyltransferase [Gammaproteobacteria bacterium]